MKVLLLQNVKKIGQKGEIKNVNDGYAMNFLFPKKLAQMATDGTVKKIDQKNKKQKESHDRAVGSIHQVFEILNNKRITILKKASEKGSLFSALHVDDIIKALFDNFKVVLQPEWFVDYKDIKHVGEHNISIMYEKKKVQIILLVEGE